MYNVVLKSTHGIYNEFVQGIYRGVPWVSQYDDPRQSLEKRRIYHRLLKENMWLCDIHIVHDNFPKSYPIEKVDDCDANLGTRPNIQKLFSK